MKRIRLLLASAGLLFSVVAPILLTTTVQAATVPPLFCPQELNLIEGDGPLPTCDLSIDKQVSVNGGAFVEADTSGVAANAHVGDTVTWQIIVANTSTAGLYPQGVVFIGDVLPSQFTINSHTQTAGTFFDDGVNRAWQLPLNIDGPTLPATLTLTTTANATGSVKNTAAFSREDHAGSGCPDGGCPYVDGNSTNNSNDAWVNIQTPPQVLGVSTGDPQVLGLTDTGSGTTESIIASVLILITFGVAAYGRLYRKKSYYKL